MKSLSTKELKNKVFNTNNTKKMRDWIINNMPEFRYKPKGRKRKRRTEFSPNEVKQIAEAYGLDNEEIHTLLTNK